jgi:hypothetical protein
VWGELEIVGLKDDAPKTFGAECWCDICDQPVLSGEYWESIPAIGIMHAYHEWDDPRTWRTWTG